MNSLLLEMLGPVAKMLVTAEIQKISAEITPEEIEKKFDLDALIKKLEADPKLTALKPVLDQLATTGVDLGQVFAQLIEAILQELPAVIANITL